MAAREDWWDDAGDDLVLHPERPAADRPRLTGVLVVFVAAVVAIQIASGALLV